MIFTDYEISRLVPLLGPRCVLNFFTYFLGARVQGVNQLDRFSIFILYSNLEERECDKI